MPYQYMQYIFYPASTALPMRPYGLGQPYTLLDEARYRAEHMVKVLTAVRDTMPQNPVQDSEILKIFMASEFFFRSSTGKPDGSGHYSLFHVQAARQVIRTAVLKDKRFDDWLIVPGTAIYAQQQAKKLATPVIFNEVWAIARATTTNTKVEVTCQKQYFSDVDNLDYTKAALTGTGALAKVASYVNHQIFTIGGIDIGLEVCLDHRLEALKRTVTANPLHPRNVDIHLLPACGMETIDSSVAARLNGYFLRCNGNDWALRRVELFLVDAWPNGVPESGAKPSLYDLDAHLTAQVLSASLQIYGPGYADMVGFSDVCAL